MALSRWQVLSQKRRPAWWIASLAAGLAACEAGVSPIGPAAADQREGPATATLAIQVATRGSVAPGVAAFPLTVDGIDHQASPSGRVLLTVEAGAHRIELHDLPRHCQIRTASGPSGVAWRVAREVAVSAGQTASIGFDAVCSETGTIRIETRTNPDAEYHLLIGFVSNHPTWLIEVAPTGAIVLRDVSAGPHSVQIPLPPGCTGDSVRAAQVRPNGVDTLRFAHHCPPPAT